MSHHKCPGCDEYSCHEYNQLSRRHFMGLAGGSLAAAAVPAWLPRVVLAQEDSSTRDVIVQIFLRGGADALTMAPPHGDSDYYELRPTLAVPRPDANVAQRALDLDGFFGFAPAMQPLMEAYQDGRLLVVHACGLDHSTRSHFEAMNLMETGVSEPSGDVFTGWLGRHLQLSAPTVESAVLRAFAIGAALPRTLVGAPKSLPLADASQFGFGGDPETLDRRSEALAKMYEQAPQLLKRIADDTFGAVELLKTIDFAGYQPSGGAVYPEGDLGEALKSTAALIRAQVGVEAAAIDVGGWDTHAAQGPLNGDMAGLMNGLAAGLAAFDADLQGAGETQVTLVVMSEFGRNAFENGSAGTDHGSGGLMLVLGEAIRGGRVLTEWPGLARELLFEGQDLGIAVDYRDILVEILEKRLANSDYPSIFPDPSYSPRNYGVAVSRSTT